MDHNTQILIGLIVYGIIMFGLGFYYRPRFDSFAQGVKEWLNRHFGTKIVRGKVAKPKPPRTPEEMLIEKVGEIPIDDKILDIINKPPMDDYERELFDPGIGVRLNGQPSIREQVLARDSLVPVVVFNSKIVSGQWTCPYTNKQMTLPSEIEIDHIVPLAEAWISGAKNWNNSKRSSFSRDIDNLISVSSAANQQKGAKGPDKWLPAITTVRAWYIQRWAYTKVKWNLGMSQEEILAMSKYSQ